MKKTYIYLALGAAAAWWFIKRKKNTEETKVDPILIEFGTESGGEIPVRWTYADGTVENKKLAVKDALELLEYARKHRTEYKTNVAEISAFGGGVVRPKA